MFTGITRMTRGNQIARPVRSASANRDTMVPCQALGRPAIDAPITIIGKPSHPLSKRTFTGRAAIPSPVVALGLAMPESFGISSAPPIGGFLTGSRVAYAPSLAISSTACSVAFCWLVSIVPMLWSTDLASIGVAINARAVPVKLIVWFGLLASAAGFHRN